MNVLLGFEGMQRLLGCTVFGGLAGKLSLGLALQLFECGRSLSFGAVVAALVYGAHAEHQGQQQAEQDGDFGEGGHG